MGHESDNASKVKEGVGRIEDLIAGFFDSLQARSADAFSAGTGGKSSQNYLRYLAQESDSLVETLKLEIFRVLNSVPQKVLVIKEEGPGQSSQQGRQDDELLDKVKSVTKNLRSALSQAEMLKSDQNEDRDFDLV